MNLAHLHLILNHAPVPFHFSWGLLGASVIVGGLMAWTASLGGEIRHSEIRSVPGVGISVTERKHE